jgi:hypothetical protein
MKHNTSWHCHAKMVDLLQAETLSMNEVAVKSSSAATNKNKTKKIVNSAFGLTI